MPPNLAESTVRPRDAPIRVPHSVYVILVLREKHEVLKFIQLNIEAGSSAVSAAAATEMRNAIVCVVTLLPTYLPTYCIAFYVVVIFRP